MNLSKNRKKFYCSADFKIDVLNILLNSTLFEKIALEVNVFEAKVYEYVLDSLFSKSMIIIGLTDELKFKADLSQKKILLKTNKILEINENELNYEEKNLNTFNEKFENDEIFNYDKCVICDEFFFLNEKDANKNNKNYKDNNNSSSSEDNEGLFNFNPENVDFKSSQVNNNFYSSNNFQDDLLLGNFNNINAVENNNERISKVQCPFCRNKLHTICFAEFLLEDENDMIIPKEGVCLVCTKEFRWSEFLIKD